MLTVSLLFCAMMALTRAAAVPEAEPGEKTGPLIQEVKSHMVKRATPCPSGWTDSKGRCFLFVPKRMTWGNAERHCQTFGGNLASVHSLDEQKSIQSLAKGKGLTWLGAYDAQQEGVWLWSDGTPFSYNYWDRGQPDNRDNSDCLVMNYGDAKKHDDTLCSLKRPFVCAKKP